MKRLHSTRPVSSWIWRLLLALAVAVPASLTQIEYQPQAGGIGGLIPFFNILVGLKKRNEVYETVNAYIDEKNDYYDRLRETAKNQLADRKIIGMRDSQVAAFIKMVELIEQERKAMEVFSESEKKAARDEFVQTVNKEVMDRMLASTPATRVLGAFQNGISSSQGLISEALDELAGEGVGKLDDIHKVRDIATRIQIAGQIIGGDAGKSIQTIAGKVVEIINRPSDEIEAGLIQVSEELGELGDIISGLQDQGYTASANELGKDVLITLITGEGNPAIQSITDMLVAEHNRDADFRDRARDVISGTTSVRCAAKAHQITEILDRIEFFYQDPEPSEAEVELADCQPFDITSLVESSQTSSQPTATASSSAARPTATQEEPTLAWVLTSTESNPNNEQDAFYGGGQDPYWFPEERFKGTHVIYDCGPGNLSVQDASVDHGYEYHDVTIGVGMDSPPARLDPGQEITLNVSASHSGTVNEGGIGAGLIFQYSYLGNAVGTPFTYSPWNPAFDGTSSVSYTFTAPAISSAGDTFQLSAGLWNSPPCHVVWTYEAQ